MIIHTVFSYPPLYFMLQLAAAAPGLFMPLFMLLLKMILLKILVIIVGIIVVIFFPTYPKKFDIANLLAQ